MPLNTRIVLYESMHSMNAPGTGERGLEGGRGSRATERLIDSLRTHQTEPSSGGVIYKCVGPVKSARNERQMLEFDAKRRVAIAADVALGRLPDSHLPPKTPFTNPAANRPYDTRRYIEWLFRDKDRLK